MIVKETKTDIRQLMRYWSDSGLRIAAVPTMGALHEGHLSLIDTARVHADRVVATIFVNPTQFAPNEDFDSYPRTLERDVELLAERGCDAIFAPNSEELYSPGFSTTISVGDITQDFCGAFRPTFFDGVATIVAKLLIILTPDVAVFGQKDYQQLLMLKRLARDLDMAVDIVGAPTVREPDGLALSSRNAYLSASERQTAPLLHRTLQEAAERLGQGDVSFEAIETWAMQRLKDAGFATVDYFALADGQTLQRIDRAAPDGRLLAAAWLGKARLIDNIPVLASN